MSKAAAHRMNAAKGWKLGTEARQELLDRAEQIDGAKLTVVESGILHNALGLLYDKKPYRNHFCAARAGSQREACEALAARGLLTKDAKSQPSGNCFFYVTEAGAALLGHKLPKD